MLIFSLFVPVVCAVQNAWSAPSPSCGEMNHAPQSIPMVSPCCLNVAIERPVLQEVTRHDTPLAPAPAVPASTLPTGEPNADPRIGCSSIPIGDPSPPHIYVLHSTFLI